MLGGPEHSIGLFHREDLRVSPAHPELDRPFLHSAEPIILPSVVTGREIAEELRLGQQPRHPGGDPAMLGPEP